MAILLTRQLMYGWRGGGGGDTHRVGEREREKYRNGDEGRREIKRFVGTSMYQVKCVTSLIYHSPL